MVYRFDEFEVDDREFRLSEDGTSLQVEPKVLRLLVCLIENRNRLVRKQELLDKVWPDAMVTENALTRAIGLLRKALNDDTHVPKFIETVPTAGYRFIAKVIVAGDSSAPASARTMSSSPTTAEAKTAPSRSGKWIFASILLLATAALGTFLFFSHSKKLLTEKDTVVLADFANSTGDPVFDGTLRQGMEVQLEQSPFLSLIPDERIRQVLRMMGLPADARLTPVIAREICERTASSAVLDGSIAPLGTQYVLGLRATDCVHGKVLAEEQVQAAKKEDVLHALDQITGRFRTRLGESLASVEKYDTPLAEATTPSLDALKALSLARKKSVAGELTAALPLLNRAVELDPNFAMAYAAISSTYNSLQQPERAAENIRRAYELRERVSEPERLGIEANYYSSGTGELEKAVSAYELWQQTYPRAAVPYSSLGVTYRRLGNTEKALVQNRESMRLAPDVAVSYQNLGADYVNLNRLDEAEAVYKQAEDRKLEFQGHIRSRYLLAFLKGDAAQMAQLASSAKGKRGIEDAVLSAQADTAAWYGKLNDAREVTRQAMDLAQRNDAKENAANYQAEEALFEADMGNRQQARADADAAMKLDPTRDVQEMAALVMANTGDTAAAEKLAAELDKNSPKATLVQRYWLPTIRAAIALQRKDPNQAIQQLQQASDIELGSPRLLPAYLRGYAYLMLHDGNRAAAEFQKYLDHYGLVRNLPWGALARLGLARAYTMQGNTPKARAAYHDFLTLWKDADPDVPILQQATEEYAKLQ